MKNKLKKTILCFVDYYLPGYKAGGPIQSIANLVENLGDEFEFYIICNDRDQLDRQPYANVPIINVLPNDRKSKITKCI